MSVSKQDLKARYEQLSAEALLDLWQRDTLTDTAKLVIQAELQSRGITPPRLQTSHFEEQLSDIEPWVTVARLTTAPEAHIVRARLESEAIPAMIADEHLVTANWFLSNAIGGVRVQVPQSYTERANRILKELEAGEYALSDDELAVRKCPNCGSDDVIQDKRSQKASLLALFFFQLPLPFSHNAYKCNNCGHVWKSHD